MSIKQGNEIKELRGRIEALEGKINELGLEPRKVAGFSDVEVKPAPKKAKKTKAKVEGSE
ncbi:MAG: hypothetical protein JKY52_09370 [Flavobacteriales bacterium]|nr:hypothetical protein [Flavobacteriales bacterium]